MLISNSKGLFIGVVIGHLLCLFAPIDRHSCPMPPATNQWFHFSGTTTCYPQIMHWSSVHFQCGIGWDCYYLKRCFVGDWFRRCPKAMANLKGNNTKLKNVFVICGPTECVLSVWTGKCTLITRKSPPDALTVTFAIYTKSFSLELQQISHLEDITGLILCSLVLALGESCSCPHILIGLSRATGIT